MISSTLISVLHCSSESRDERETLTATIRSPLSSALYVMLNAPLPTRCLKERSSTRILSASTLAAASAAPAAADGVSDVVSNLVSVVGCSLLGLFATNTHELSCSSCWQ